MTQTINTQSFIKLDFEIGKIDNKSMTMILVHENAKKVYSNLEEKFTLQMSINFPTQVKLILLGKKNNDTVVDENQNVVQDKFVKLTKLEVDNLQCNNFYLKNKIKLTTADSQVIHDNYWGSNGEVILDFNQKNSIFWALETGSTKP
jgi:hypothetical protein